MVLIIDDCQWLEPAEVSLWRHFLESDHALNHMLVACAYRVEDNSPPAPSTLLAVSSTQMLVDRLPEDSVLDLLQACFHNSLDQGANLVSFLHAETAGSPLYLRSLVSTLVSLLILSGLVADDQVRDHTIYFDWNMLLWRHDTMALQSHLSNRKVDDFLDTIMRNFSPTTQQVLKVS